MKSLKIYKIISTKVLKIARAVLIIFMLIISSVQPSEIRLIRNVSTLLFSNKKNITHNTLLP